MIIQKLVMHYSYIILITLVFVVGVLVAILSLLEKVLASQIEATIDRRPSEYIYNLNQQRINIKQIKQVVTILTTIFVTAGIVYLLVKDTYIQGYVIEWLNLLVRWVHVVAGIMWIGASFYFVFLENNLNRTEGIRDELAGNLWAIHGGGFYFLEKYKVAPKQLPKTLHWFKYEAYFTWLSGFSLLCVVYYMDAKAFLLDPQVADISSSTGILIGIASMAVGWIIYDQMCKSSLVKKQILFAVIGFLILSGFAYFFTQIFNSRAAYIHVGAVMGTLMAWNVYFVIIPAQKALVKAAVLGKPLDPSLGKKAGERSLHNNYLTLPVIFIMISNHFPSTFGNAYNWLILLGITLASAGIKHYWNLKERKVKTKYILPISIIGMLSLAIVSAPVLDQPEESEESVSFSEVRVIVDTHC
ncbi:MAG: urate hydroxylase PuuD, partial [Cyclobacteriaceae bacterium]